MTIKLPDEQMAALGIDSAEGVLRVISEQAANKADLSSKDAELSIEKVGWLMSKSAAFSEIIKQLSARVDTLEEALESMNAEEITKSATAEATKSVLELVAKIGGQALPKPDATADPDNATAASASDDPKVQWERNASLRDEFSTFESFAAYDRAVKAGQVRMFEKRN